MQAGIEQSEAGGKYTSLGLDAADQYAVDLQLAEIINSRRRGKIAVLDESVVSENEAIVRLSRPPSELVFEGRDGFIVPFDRRYAREHGAQVADPLHDLDRHRKTGLNVDDKECLLHKAITHRTKLPARFRGRMPACDQRPRRMATSLRR
jgi:hypothetical protein